MKTVREREIYRIRAWTDGVLGEEQCCFRSWRSVDHLFLVRQLCEFFLVTQKDLFWAFLDLGKTFDRVDRDALWQVLRLYEVGCKLPQAD